MYDSLLKVVNSDSQKNMDFMLNYTPQINSNEVTHGIGPCHIFPTS